MAAGGGIGIRRVAGVASGSKGASRDSLCSYAKSERNDSHLQLAINVWRTYGNVHNRRMHIHDPLRRRMTATPPPQTGEEGLSSWPLRRQTCIPLGDARGEQYAHADH